MTTETVTNLTLTIMDDEQKQRCNTNYNFIVQSRSAAHTAFHTREGLHFWLNQCGLTIGNKIEHLWNTYEIVGRYSTVCLFAIDPYLPDYSNVRDLAVWTNEDLNRFGSKNNLRRSVWMSNGDYTTCYIFNGYECGNVIYYLNPNCHTREVHGHMEYKADPALYPDEKI